jgi:hypothetical protein
MKHPFEYRPRDVNSRRRRDIASLVLTNARDNEDEEHEDEGEEEDDASWLCERCANEYSSISLRGCDTLRCCRKDTKGLSSKALRSSASRWRVSTVGASPSTAWESFISACLSAKPIVSS